MQKLSNSGESTIKRLQYSPFTGQNDVPVKYSGAPSPLEHTDISFLHFHNDLEIGYCIEGTGMCVIGEKVFTFSPGDYIIIAPDIPHYHRTISEEPCVCDFIFFDFEKIFSIFKIDSLKDISFLNTDVSSQVIRATAPDELLTPLNDIVKIATDYDRTKNISELLICFFLLSERLKKLGSHFKFSKISPGEQKLTPAINLIALEYGSELDIEDLANACHLSKSHFMKEFNNTFGISAYAFLNRFRVYAAKEMLDHTDYSVEYIGEVCGFNNFSNFFRQFKKYFDASPSKYRSKHSSK